jgi:hypothetical protein
MDDIEEQILCTLGLIGEPMTAQELAVCTGRHIRTIKQRVEFMFFDRKLNATTREGTHETEYLPS